MKHYLVVIDDEICPRSVGELCGKNMEAWKVENGLCIPDHPPFYSQTHGTVCASLAGEFLAEWKLVGISTGGQGNTQVENVCSALEWCGQAGAAMVCMSMGVTCGMGLERMSDVTRTLQETGCQIFCACSNDGKLTFPAAYPWVTGVTFDPSIQGVLRTDSRWGCDVAVGPFPSRVLDKLAQRNGFFHRRTNSLTVAYAASRVLRAGGVEHLPAMKREGFVPSVKEAFQKWEKPVVKVGHSREKWESLLGWLEKESYWPVLLTSQEPTDWSKMTAGVENLEEAAALLPLLKEVGILFLDLPEEGPKVWDFELDLASFETEEAYCRIVEFFGEEETP